MTRDNRHDWFEFFFTLWVLSYPEERRWWHKPPAITFRRLKRWALKEAAKE